MIFGFDFSKENLIDLIINYALLAIYRKVLLINQGKTFSGQELIVMFKFIIKKRFQIEKIKRKQHLFIDQAEWVQLMNKL